MTTLMGHNLATVYPYPRVIVHRPKVQNGSAIIGWQMEFPLIPTHAMKITIADAAFL
jgi:hypothetical protein